MCIRDSTSTTTTTTTPAPQSTTLEVPNQNSELIAKLRLAEQRKEHIRLYCVNHPDNPSCGHWIHEANLKVREAKRALEEDKLSSKV